MGRKLDVGFTRLDGQMALLIQRHDQSAEKIEDLETRVAELGRAVDVLERGETDRQKRNESRVADLEKSRWPLASLAALVGLAGLVIGLYQLIAAK
jgi:hypothetical protein